MEAASDNTSALKLSEVISALSYALDITEGQPEGHAARSCVIGMRIARELKLPDAQRSSLFYALLLKDLGCSSNAAKMCALFGADDRQAKRDAKTTEWTSLVEQFKYIRQHVEPSASPLRKTIRIAKLSMTGPAAAKEMFQIRCDRGGQIARMFGFPDETAQAIRALDEHWDGNGHPLGTKGDAIPLLGRILGISQTVEVFLAAYELEAACQMAQQRRGTWFDPALVDILLSLRTDSVFWETLSHADVLKQCAELEPRDELIYADETLLDTISEGFAQVIDAKSPWTFRHSTRVAEIAVGIGDVLGLSQSRLRILKRAGLLHDIGKLGISNTILDKPGKLTVEEVAEVHKHPAFTQHILSRISTFSNLTEMAASHHERMDGRGYHRGLNGSQLSIEARILCVADVFEALSAERPYRPKLSRETVLEIMQKDAGPALCPESFAALKTFLEQKNFV